MNLEIRKCNICLIEKTVTEFDKKKYTCKRCNSNNYVKNKVNDRTPYRVRLKELCDKDDVTDEEFNKHFIPFEKFQIMKKLPELYTIHQCTEIRKLDRNQNKSDYENKYFFDVAFIGDKKRNSYYRIHII